MIPIHESQIGGGKVRRMFSKGSVKLRPGTVLTGDEVRSIRALNRTALIEKGYLDIWPVVDVPAEGTARFIRPLGFGRYDVIEGRKLNDEALDKEAAHKMAGIPMPDNGGKD